MSSNVDVQPTAKEAQFMLNVLYNQEGQPKVNWNKVAEAMGLKNAATATARFGQIKKRLGWNTITTTNGGGPSASGGNATTTSRVTAKSVGSGTNISPSKVTKSRGRPATAGKSPKGKGKVAKPAVTVKDETENENEQEESIKLEPREAEDEGDDDEKVGDMEVSDNNED